MTGRLAILGAGGHGKVVADTAIEAGWSAVTFFDDRWPECSRNGPWEVAGDGAALMAQLAGFDGIAVAIGDNAQRLSKARHLEDSGARLPPIVHPAAFVSGHAQLGAAVVVFAGAVINVDARIGFTAIINTGATIDHDCVLAEGVHVSPGAHLAGGVKVGQGAWIGIGASIKQDVAIGARAVVGAGAVVIADVADGATVAGVPARPIKASR